MCNSVALVTYDERIVWLPLTDFPFVIKQGPQHGSVCFSRISQKSKVFSILARKMRHNARQSDNNRRYIFWSNYKTTVLNIKR